MALALALIRVNGTRENARLVDVTCNTPPETFSLLANSR